MIPLENIGVTLYEYPFNERIRTYLRLENLFRRLGVLVPRDHPLDHHYAIATIFEAMEVASRADLKSDLLKDLERQRQIMNSYRGNPAISEAALDQVLNQLESCHSSLNSLPGKAGQLLTDNEWLMGIRSRVGIPGGTCEFDLPAYHAWQQGDASSRRKDVEAWARTLGPVAESVHVVLRLLRDSGTPQKVMSNGGQFQQKLAEGKTYQLMRLRIDTSGGLIPEISGNRLIVSVRLLRLESDSRLHAASEDAGFEMTLCS
jgi:cell division protein ZapD